MATISSATTLPTSRTRQLPHMGGLRDTDQRARVFTALLGHGDEALDDFACSDRASRGRPRDCPASSARHDDHEDRNSVALLVEAAPPRRARSTTADAALAFVGRTITASAMHRAISVDAAPDGMTLQQWRLWTVRTAVAYLTIDQSPVPDPP
ncbi:hypothetical protein [Nocardia brasiliensis]